MVAHRLECHNHHIHLWHIVDRAIGIDVGQHVVALVRVNDKSVSFHLLIVAVQQKMHLFASPCQFAAVVTAYGSCSYYCVFHLRLSLIVFFCVWQGALLLLVC